MLLKKPTKNCDLLDAACELVGSLFAHWDDVVDAHVAGARCAPCSGRTDDFSTTKLAVDPTAVVARHISEVSA